MATFKKPLYTVEVITTCGESYTVSDTVDKQVGAAVLSAFKRGDTLVLETGENETTYVPFHAVCALVVTISTEDVEKADPYNCEPENNEQTPDEQPDEPVNP